MIECRSVSRISDDQRELIEPVDGDRHWHSRRRTGQHATAIERRAIAVEREDHAPIGTHFIVQANHGVERGAGAAELHPDVRVRVYAKAFDVRHPADAQRAAVARAQVAVALISFGRSPSIDRRRPVHVADKARDIRANRRREGARGQQRDRHDSEHAESHTSSRHGGDSRLGGGGDSGAGALARKGVGGQQLIVVALRGVLRFVLRASLPSQVSNHGLVRQQFFQDVSEILGIARSIESTGVPIPDHFGGGADLGGDHRQSGGERLDERHREAFVVSRTERRGARRAA